MKCFNYFMREQDEDVFSLFFWLFHMDFFGCFFLFFYFRTTPKKRQPKRKSIFLSRSEMNLVCDFSFVFCLFFLVILLVLLVDDDAAVGLSLCWHLIDFSDRKNSFRLLSIHLKIVFFMYFDQCRIKPKKKSRNLLIFNWLCSHRWTHKSIRPCRTQCMRNLSSSSLVLLFIALIDENLH